MLYQMIHMALHRSWPLIFWTNSVDDISPWHHHRLSCIISCGLPSASSTDHHNFLQRTYTKNVLSHCKINVHIFLKKNSQLLCISKYQQEHLEPPSPESSSLPSLIGPEPWAWKESEKPSNSACLAIISSIRNLEEEDN